MTRDEQAELGVERPEAYEHTDVGSNGVLIFMGGLLLTIIVSLIIVWGLFGWFGSERTESEPFPLPKVSQVPPEPRIQAQPLVDHWNFLAQQRAILNSYGWVDQQAGTVRIPIERAMDLLAQRGLPTRTGPGPGPLVPETGPLSGGPQTGNATPRSNPNTPFQTSRPLPGAAETVPTPNRPVPGMANSIAPGGIK